MEKKATNITTYQEKFAFAFIVLRPMKQKEKRKIIYPVCQKKGVHL